MVLAISAVQVTSGAPWLFNGEKNAENPQGKQKKKEVTVAVYLLKRCFKILK